MRQSRDGRMMEVADQSGFRNGVRVTCFGLNGWGTITPCRGYGFSWVQVWVQSGFVGIKTCAG